MTDEGRKRGRRAEDQVCMLIREMRPMNMWIVDARRCTPEEDARGIDIVITFDHGGEGHLQVKASSSDLGRHRRRYPTIPVVVHNPTEYMHARREARRRQLVAVLHALYEWSRPRAQP